jgi:hypothetical protein
MNELDGLLKLLGFLPARYIRGRLSIADLFPVSKRCGVYILEFGDGDVYVGQTVDVTRRYVQHCKIHSDITSISFRRVAKKNLNETERTAIWMLEQNGYRLRNITFTSIPRGEFDFDFVMCPEDQHEWLANLDYIDDRGNRFNDIALRQRYTRKLQQFLKQPFADQAINVLRAYVRQGLPAYARSEMSFWACSCLPAYSNSAIVIYSRININWQEVFTICSENETLICSWHVARAPLEQVFGESLDSLQVRYPDLSVTEHYYEPGGQDQINLVTEGEELALEMLNDKAVLAAVRLFNLRLMQKGPCTYNRYHCFDLADRLI